MVFEKHQVANNAKWQLNAAIWSDTLSLTLKTNEGDRFPDHNWTTDKDYPCTLVNYDVDLVTVLKREIVLVTAKSWDTFTITRWRGTCIGADGETAQGNTQYSFSEDDYFFNGVVAETIQDIQNELDRLEADKADDNSVVHDTGNETVAWVKTFLSSPIVPTPASGTEAANKDYVDSVSGGSDNSFMAGESISAWNCMYLERGVTFAQAVGVQNIWDVTANTRIAFKIVWSWDAASSLKLSLKKTASPAGNLNVRIETDSAWSPSWTLADANATWSVTAASLSTSLADTTVNLAWSVTLVAGTTYRVVLYQGTYWAETISWTNYYNAWYNAIITERLGKLYNWSAWAAPVAVTDNNGARWSTSSYSNKQWVVIYSKYDQTLIRAIKDSSTTATKCYLFSWNDLQTTLLAIADFSWDNAYFNYKLTAWSYYTIVLDNDGASYTGAYWWSASYPYNLTNVNITTGASANTSQTLVFASVETQINLTWYAYWTGIEADLLFKTDSDLAHKVPVATEPLKIASEAKSAWGFPAYTLPWGVNKTVSWLTAWVEYFLSWTAWGLSATPWTYKYKAWIAISPTMLLQNSKSLLSSVQAAWSSPYTYQNTTGVPVQLLIRWWTVSVVAYSRDWVTYTTVATATNTQIVLQPYDYCKITYSSLPTLYINHY